MRLENGCEMEERADLVTGNGGVGLGPWIHAPKRGRRRTSKESLTDGRSNHGKIAISSGDSRFGILADLGDQGNDLATVNSEENQAPEVRNKPLKVSVIRGDGSGNL